METITKYIQNYFNLRTYLMLLQAILLSITGIAQVVISHDNLPPDSSAMLEIRSTAKGLLTPRMMCSQMLAIPHPAPGLLVYCHSVGDDSLGQYQPGFHYYNGGSWQPLRPEETTSLVNVLDQPSIDSLSPIAGTIVLNSTTNCINYFTGISWMELCGHCIPQPTQSQAGGDQVIAGSTTLLEANVPLSGNGYWEVISGDSGVVSDPYSPNTGFSGIQPGNYMLRWTISTICGSSTDEVNIIFIDPLPPAQDEILFVPYVDCTLWPNFPIENVNETGILQYTCAFITDNPSVSGANPCWAGYSTLQMDYYQDHISALRNQGGDVIISFGGANGVELSYAATDEFQARDAYKTVIDAYDLTSIDLDIEGLHLAHAASILRRSKALRLLQQEYPSLRVSLTLPVMPTGLTNDGLNVVQSALDQDVNISCINIMAMDYGPSGIDMGDAAISAGEAVFLQLKSLYLNAGMPLADSILWRKIGITPMIGENDVAGEIFYTEDASDLANWAAERKIGRLSMWSANRDHECTHPNDPLYSCSHVTQEPYEFSAILGSVASGTILSPKPPENLSPYFILPNNR